MALLKPTQAVAPQNDQSNQACQGQPVDQTAANQGGAVNQETVTHQPAQDQGSGAGSWHEVDQSTMQQPQDTAAYAQQTNVPAVAPQNTAVATTTRQAISAAPDLAEAGFGGLAIGARSFPIIALKTDGLFEDTDGATYGKGFKCRMINSRAKTAVQGVKHANGKPDEKVFFTYDGIMSTSGRPVADLEAEFLAEGRTLARREYTDALVTMEAPGESFDQELRILSIAPTSRERLSGAIMTLAIRNGWNTADLQNNIGNYLMSVECGAKVTKAQQPFYPWQFRFEK
jgi:hypothetical protein